jgi:hypothetical protein
LIGRKSYTISRSSLGKFKNLNGSAMVNRLIGADEIGSPAMAERVSLDV